MQASIESSPDQNSSRLAGATRAALMLGTALLVMPAFAAPHAAETHKHKAHAAKAHQKVSSSKKAHAAKAAGKASGKTTAAPQKPGPLADFGKESAAPDVVHVANWVSYTHNNLRRAFVLIDKKAARLYLFDPQGKLRSSSPVLLGEAVGDNDAPVGNKPISQIKPSEKTTPAGRFLAIPGKNSHGANIIWIDYKNSISMHAIHSVSAAEHRADRMAASDPREHRISYGCVNVPPKYYDSVLRPTVLKHGAYVYVLPETRTPQQQFGSFDVPPSGAQLAQATVGTQAKTGK